MPLPTAKTPPKRSLSDVSILLYGPSKIGKSTFASQAPDAIFLATEPGLNALEVYQQPIRNWGEFLEICAELAKGEHPFKTVVIDTIDILYRLCADHICQKRGLEHESDGSHGKIYGLIKNEIYRVLTKLAHLPYGLILISHSQDRDLETRTGTVTRTVPTLSESFRQIVIGLVDLILYCDVQVEQAEDGTRKYRRVVRTKPSPNYDAGDRFGCLPEVMDLNFQAFAKAFEIPKTNTTPASAGAAKSTK
ncbi:ATP-binding protein [bacterium]|nr:ATP-binding protein [bacterium]